MPAATGRRSRRCAGRSGPRGSAKGERRRPFERVDRCGSSFAAFGRAGPPSGREPPIWLITSSSSAVSIGPRVASPFADLLWTLARALRKLGVRWFLFGAQAAILHGAERLTNDVDVTVDLGDLPIGVFVAALERAGFALRVRDIDGFVERTRVVPLRDRRSGIDLDVVIAGPGPEQLFLERAERRRIEGVSVPVASAEDLVAMKILAGRPKDLEDVESVLAAKGDTFRIERARRTLRSLETALGQSDLLPSFEGAVTRTRRTRGTRIPAGRRKSRKGQPRRRTRR